MFRTHSFWKQGFSFVLLKKLKNVIKVYANDVYLFKKLANSKQGNLQNLFLGNGNRKVHGGVGNA